MTAPNRLGFVLDIDPASFVLNAAEGAAEVTEVIRPAQMAVAGNYMSRRYGKFSITEADIDRMVGNFTSAQHPVSPTELSVDYDHNEGKAAGWIKKLWKKVSTVSGKRIVELWGDVAWTKPAAQAIANKEYRFFSPMFDKDFMSNVGRKLGACLLGGGLTNRPFLQGMTAISLSSRDEDLALPASATGAKNMRLITVKDSTGNDVQIDLDVVKDHADIKALSTPAASATATLIPGAVDPNVAALVTGMKSMQETVVALAGAIANRDKQDRKSEAERLLSDAVKSGRLLPVDVDNYMLLSESDAGMAKIKALAARKPNSVIKLRAGAGGTTSEIEAGESGDEGNDDAVTIENADVKFEKAIADVMTKDPKLSYDKAMKIAEDADPKLAKAFRLSFSRT